MSRPPLQDRIHPAPDLTTWVPDPNRWSFWKEVLGEEVVGSQAAASYRALLRSLDGSLVLRNVNDLRAAVRADHSTLNDALDLLAEHGLIDLERGGSQWEYGRRFRPILSITIHPLPPVPADVVEQAHLLWRGQPDHVRAGVRRADVRKFLAWRRDALDEPYDPHPADWRLVRGLLVTYGLGRLKKIAWHVLRCGTDAIPQHRADRRSIRSLAAWISACAVEQSRCPRCCPPRNPDLTPPAWSEKYQEKMREAAARQEKFRQRIEGRARRRR